MVHSLDVSIRSTNSATGRPASAGSGAGDFTRTSRVASGRTSFRGNRPAVAVARKINNRRRCGRGGGKNGGETQNKKKTAENEKGRRTKAHIAVVNLCDSEFLRVRREQVRYGRTGEEIKAEILISFSVRVGR